MSLLRVIFLALCLAAAPLASLGSAPVWETVHGFPAPAQADDGSEEAVTVTVRDGYIYVTASRPVTVRVMTILGQLISQHNLPEGTSRLKVSARGIYILKAGGQTLRVTI